MTYKRTQELHDLAYDIVQRMIEKKLKEKIKEEFEIIDYNFNEPSPEHSHINPTDDEYLRGYIEMVRYVFEWKPPYSKRNLPINLEIKRILDKKRKIVMNQIKDQVFDISNPLRQCLI